MIQEFLRTTPFAFWPLMAFFLFFGTFIAVLAVVLWGAWKKRAFDDVAHLPLLDDQGEER
ncbi:MAG: hypothetical protein HKN21_17280 [Candidatus Eisenbacteria bacterium]|uniref:Cbb3-type cytochrome c oxidase subunit 3 n=1 Tax=Eiseniibacteriota bacterium TaxID=2212470 RepID=A0A7Y2EHC3_UNCEI|nr:hypothetical protein [Candidatus Eisenbacteria bacterium]